MSRRGSLCIVLLFATSLVSMGVAADSGYSGTRAFESTELNFNVHFDEQRKVVDVHVENPGQEWVKSTFSITVDGWMHTRETFKIGAHGERTWTVNVTDGISVMDVEHSVSVQTYGGNETFYFVEEFDTAAPDNVPTPRILDIEVDEGTARGNQSTLVSITVTNPSKQSYLMHLLVHTLKTDSSYPSFHVMPGETKVVEAEVYEPLGSRVSGEVRFFLQRAGQPSHGLQQFEFTGRANGTTEYWKEGYREIPSPDAEDPYHYENESLDPADDASLIPTDAPALGFYATGATVFVAVLVGWVGWRRLRSPT